MKKKLVLPLCFLTICLLLFGCSNKYISKNQAKEAVLNDSNWNVDDVKFTEIELDRKKGIYEIEFIADGKYEYEYEVNAENGEIIVDDDFIVYSPTDAQNIAMGDAGLTENDITIKSNKTTNKGGQTYYEIEFVDEGNYSHEYEISANDGSITKSEISSPDLDLLNELKNSDDNSNYNSNDGFDD